MNLNFEIARERMVDNQLRPNKIKEEKILNLFKSIPKEAFVKKEHKSICYSDQDLIISIKRGYLKNLHLAQIVSSAKIKAEDKVLHVGGLTGYVSVIIAKICKELIIIENDENNILQLKENIKKYNLENVKIINNELNEGFNNEKPYDLIIIDCPIYKLNIKFIEQINNKGGRIIYIEKTNEEISKAYKIIKMMESYSKEYLFDVFTKFVIDKKKEEFEF
tara:strand:- start:980 stop:1639 length:660 start_codon:yes stop_codon:yes gene_type:complete